MANLSCTSRTRPNDSNKLQVALPTHLPYAPSSGLQRRTSALVHPEFGTVLLLKVLRNDLCRRVDHTSDVVLVDRIGRCDQDVVARVAIHRAGAWVKGDAVRILHAYQI